MSGFRILEGKAQVIDNQRRAARSVVHRFGTVFVLGLCITAGCTNRAPTSAKQESNATTEAPPADAAQIERHEAAEFSFAVPSGWTRVPPDRANTLAMLLLGSTDWRSAQAIIKVDTGTPAFPTPREMAEEFARRDSGKVNSEPLDFDGTAAVCVTTTSTSLATPKQTLVIYRTKKAYVVRLSALEEVSIKEALEQVRSTWKWKEQESHLNRAANWRE